ncbi:hypothetical protein D3C72_2512040 [compost metagenome]
MAAHEYLGGFISQLPFQMVDVVLQLVVQVAVVAAPFGGVDGGDQRNAVGVLDLPCRVVHHPIVGVEQI